MFVVVPLLCFVLIFLVFSMKSTGCDGETGWRRFVLSASVVWALLLTTITECFSVVNLVTFEWVVGLWGLATLMAVLMFLTLPNKARLAARFEVSRLPRFEVLLIVALACIVTATGVIALVAPPNNWDSMTYHMSRVRHWIQNQSVAFYPTHILRQIQMNPWAEYAVMHLQILAGGDRFANLVQWFSMIGSLLGVSLIAEHLGANLRGQIFAAVVAATIPMGILQASSTQNDYVVSFWLVCFVSFLLLAAKEGAHWTRSLEAGASLGLAILTKATAYIFAFPVLVWFVLSQLKTGRSQSWRSLSLVVVVSLSINLGQYARNFDLYGSPVGAAQEGPSDEFKYTNDVLTLRSALSNVVRNISVHVATPIERANALIEKGIRSFHKMLGADVNDPRTTWGGEKFRVSAIFLHEDFAGAPAHLALILVSLASLLLSTQLRESRNLVGYSLAVTVAFLLFVVYLKWQPWHNRLHLPLFLFWSPVIGVVLCRIRNHRIANSIVIVLLLSALPWVFYNTSRPLLGKSNIFNTSRTDQYFRNNPELKDSYVRVTDFLKSRHCWSVGLFLGRDDWEYPFWVLLQNDGNRAVRLEHIGVRNVSAEKSHMIRDFSPCAVVSLSSGLMNVFMVR